jgi:hypothetical protein
MALPKTRNEFKQYILQELGEPVIEINIADIQTEQCIDKAVFKFQREHYNGSDTSYIPYQLTQQDLDNEYIDITSYPGIIGVTGIFNISKSSSSGILTTEFMVKSEAMYQALHAGGGLAPYAMMMQYRATIDNLINGSDAIDFNWSEGIVRINTSWSKFSLGDIIMLDAVVAIDETVNPRFWANEWLRDYARWLVQFQWGSNLIKFTGVELPGGVVLNGDKLYEEAKAALQLMNDKLLSEAQLPPDFEVG